jgi:hypothetical protein
MSLASAQHNFQIALEELERNQDWIFNSFENRKWLKRMERKLHRLREDVEEDYGDRDVHKADVL